MLIYVSLFIYGGAKNAYFMRLSVSDFVKIWLE